MAEADASAIRRSPDPRIAKTKEKWRETPRDVDDTPPRHPLLLRFGARLAWAAAASHPE
jgi:hypothetical protein